MNSSASKFKDFALANIESSDGITKVQEIIKICGEFNRKVDPSDELEILFHYTNEIGAEEIIENGKINTGENGMLYLTSVPPDKARFLLSEEESKRYSIYTKEWNQDKSLTRFFDKHMLFLRFKWRHGVIRKFVNMIPMAKDKANNVLVIIVKKKSDFLGGQVLKDKYKELYIRRNIKLVGDDDVSVIGPIKLNEL